MSFTDKVKTVFKNWGSKRDENSNVRDLEDAIEAEKEKINVKIADIGEFYWNLFNKNAFVPDNEAKGLFLSIRNSNEKIAELEMEIEERRKSGDEERSLNNTQLIEKERHDAELAEQRRLEKEKRDAEIAEERRKQKEAQAEIDRIKKERRDAELAEERRKQKEAQAELERLKKEQAEKKQ